jgi:acyl-coenzyme A thioesterase PaaI-like protein
MVNADLGTLPADELREIINSWPTFAAQKISVTDIADDWTNVTVRLDLTAENANYFGTAFGGSLFSMIDPFLVILIARQLGPGYAVWDKHVEIDFVRPGLGPVTAQVEVSPEHVDTLRSATADGTPHFEWFEVPLLAEDGSTIALQRRQIYVRATEG